jgi:hypothetical protein
MLVYLDLCSIQRPLDDRTQLRIAVEAEAVLGIIAWCESGQAGLISSDALVFEAEQAPSAHRKGHALAILGKAVRFVGLSPQIEQQANTLMQAGLKPLDAFHLACAVEAAADYFCTCDDRLLRRGRAVLSGPPKIVSPLDLVAEVGL